MFNYPYRSPCHRDQRHARQDALQQSVTAHVEQEYAKFDVRDVPGDSLLLNPNITSPTVTSNDDYAASDTSTVDQGYGDAPRERTSPASNSSTSTIHSPSPIPSRPPSVPSPDSIPPPPPPQHQAWNGFKLHVPMHRSQPHRLRSILVKNVRGPTNYPQSRDPLPDPQTAGDIPTGRLAHLRLYSPRPNRHGRRALSFLEPRDLFGARAHPIRRLEGDLLGYIFCCCMDYEANDLSRALLTSDATPLVITRVCMLWQQIALRTPFLWAHLSLRPCRGRTHYRLAHLFIERAMGHDLYVHYDEDVQRGSLASENCPCALDIISENIEQIKTLELVMISEESLARFVTSVSRAAASVSPLTRFEVSTQFDHPASTTILRALPNICNAPNVRDIRWSGAVFPEDVFPWQQIVCLRLSGCLLSPRQVLRSIVNAPALRDFSACVTEAEVRNGRLVQYAAVHTETLESLALDCDGALDVLFHSLHVPRLRSLQLRPLPSMSTWAPHGSDWPFRDINVLHTFLGRLQDGLEHFLLFDGGSTFDERALLRIIEMPQASSLVDLHVSQVSGGVGDVVFPKLTPRRGAVPLLPHLERLSMFACSTSLNTISRMLDARRLFGFPLCEVALGHAHGNLSPLDYRS